MSKEKLNIKPITILLLCITLLLPMTSYASSNDEHNTQSFCDDHGHGTHVAGIISAINNDLGIVGTVSYPAKYTRSVIAVSAIDENDQRPFWSSTGKEVEVCAPGVNILSTYLNEQYATMSGTSMATPFVTGDLALLKQKYPLYTNIQLRSLLDKDILMVIFLLNNKKHPQTENAIQHLNFKTLLYTIENYFYSSFLKEIYPIFER